MVDPGDADEVARARAAEPALFPGVVALEGSISGEHGIGFVKAPFLPIELSAEEIALMQRVKAAFDPNGILNPGKIFLRAGSGSRGSLKSTGAQVHLRVPRETARPRPRPRMFAHFHDHSPTRPDFRPVPVHVSRLQPVLCPEPERCRGHAQGDRGAQGAAGGDAEEPGEIREFLRAATGGRFGAPSLVNSPSTSPGCRPAATPRRRSPSSKCRTITARSAAATCSRPAAHLLRAGRQGQGPSRVRALSDRTAAPGCLPVARSGALPNDQGKFWEMHTKLFDTPLKSAEQLTELAQARGST